MRRWIYLAILLVLSLSFNPVNQADSESCNYHSRIYAGQIGRGLRIHMKLGCNSPGKLSGSYYYEKYQEDLGLVGGVNSVGSFVLTEFADHSTGLFEGRFTSEGQAKGVWSNSSGTRKLPFVLYPIANPLPYFVEEHITRNEPILRQQRFIYEFDKSQLVRIAADFNNDGLRDWAFRDTGGWSMLETAEYSVFFRNPTGKGYSRMTLILFNPVTDYILPVRKGTARVIRRWENAPVNGEFGEEIVTGDYLKAGHCYPVTYVKGRMKFKDPEGVEWLKKSEKKGALPVKAEWCRLRDYLIHEADWNSLQ